MRLRKVLRALAGLVLRQGLVEHDAQPLAYEWRVWVGPRDSLGETRRREKEVVRRNAVVDGNTETSFAPIETAARSEQPVSRTLPSVPPHQIKAQ